MAGTITPYDTAKGRRYRARYRKPDGTQTDKRGFKTKKEAEHYLATITIAKNNGDYIDPTHGRRTIAALAQQWQQGHLASLKPSSRNTMDSAWRTHVEPRWGTRSVASIRPSEIQDWITELNTRLGAQAVRRAVFVLSQILRIAERDRLIPRNPTTGLTLPAKKRKPVRILTHQQVELLASNAEHPFLIRYLAYGGARWGEAVELQVGDLNMLRRRINIERNAVYIRGTYVIGTPKPGESRQTPMPTFLVDDFARACEGKPRTGHIFGDGHTQLPYPHATSGWFVRAVRAAQQVDPTFPTITPHDLRHTAASLAIQAGAHVKAVQRMLGHASAAMTLDIYADLFDDDLDTIAQAMANHRAAAL